MCTETCRTSTGQQNDPLIQFFYIPRQKVFKKLHEVLHEVFEKML